LVMENIILFKIASAMVFDGSSPKAIQEILRIRYNGSRGFITDEVLYTQKLKELDIIGFRNRVGQSSNADYSAVPLWKFLNAIISTDEKTSRQLLEETIIEYCALPWGQSREPDNIYRANIARDITRKWLGRYEYITNYRRDINH